MDCRRGSGAKRRPASDATPDLVLRLRPIEALRRLKRRNRNADNVTVSAQRLERGGADILVMCGKSMRR